VFGLSWWLLCAFHLAPSVCHAMGRATLADLSAGMLCSAPVVRRTIIATKLFSTAGAYAFLWDTVPSLQFADAT